MFGIVCYIKHLLLYNTPRVGLKKLNQRLSVLLVVADFYQYKAMNKRGQNSKGKDGKIFLIVCIRLLLCNIK